MMRIKGTTKALVASTDANQAVGALDPWLGAALSVAEATRNVSITGARPLGVTNCLNFGDPTRPDAFWQLSEAVRGLGDACRALGLPVTGGNVSLYNESPGGRDRADARDRRRRAARRRLDQGRARRSPSAGDAVLLDWRRDAGPGGQRLCRAGRRRARRTDRRRSTSPWRRPRRRSPGRRSRGASLRSAQDVSGGGLAVAVAEGAMWGTTTRVSAPASGSRSPTRRPSTCSARARRASSSRADRGTPRPSCCSRASTASRSRSWARSAATASSSSWPVPERRALPRSAAAASPTRSTSRWRTCGTRGRHGLNRALGWEDR